jgi:hypothetical protein
MAGSAADRQRLRGLRAAGLIDSSGLAFGWTVFTLAVTVRQGLSAAAAYQAAMLIGVALSAPFTRWVTSRLGGRELLRGLAMCEAVCRASCLILLLVGTPSPLLAAVVIVMNVFAWTGYAAMRAEVNAVETGSVSLTRYALSIAGSEALAAAVAACLVNPRHQGALLLTIPLYTLALIPQWWAAGGSRVARHSSTPDDEVSSPQSSSRPAEGGLVGGLAFLRRWPGGRASIGGGTIMLIAGGPVLLANVLAFERYGRRGVVISALSFTVGSLLSPHVSGWLEQLDPSRRNVLRPTVLWPVLGGLVVGGWMVAEANVAGLMLAQILAGTALMTFEGTMDDHCVRIESRSGTTTRLSGASSSRALGGAVAVFMVPAVLHHATMSLAAGIGAIALLSVAWVALVRQRRVMPNAVVGVARLSEIPTVAGPWGPKDSLATL